MNREQIESIVRQVVNSTAALLAIYNVLGNQQLSDISAVVIMVITVIWSWVANIDRSNTATFVRRILAAIPPVLVSFNMVTPDKAAAITGIVLAFNSTWEVIQKKDV